MPVPDANGAPDGAGASQRHHTRIDYPFAPLPEALIYDHETTATAVRVYAALARHGLDPESCYPTQARLARLLGMEERSVQRPLRELERAGWIERVPRNDEHGGRIANGFRLYADRAPERAPHADERGGDRAESGRTPRAEERAKRKQVEREHLERDNGLTLVDAREGALIIFEQFWQQFPRRTGRGAAVKAWAAAVKRAESPRQIIDGAKRYAADPAREAQFTCHPATWLNQDRWLDDPLPPRNGSAPPRRMAGTIEAAQRFLSEEGGDGAEAGIGRGAGPAGGRLPAADR